jgi:hypothetical protein
MAGFTGQGDGFPTPVGSFGDWIYGSGMDGAFTVNNARTITDGVFDGTGATLAFESPVQANFTVADLGQAITVIPLDNNVVGANVNYRITTIVSPTKVLVQVNNSIASGNPAVGGLTVSIGGIIFGGQYTDLTIPLGVTARMSYFGWNPFDGFIPGIGPFQSELEPIIQCTDTFTINGTLDLTGANAVGSAPGDSSLRGLGDGCGGSPGGAGTTTTGGNSGLNLFGSAGTGPNNGAGGNGSAGNGGIGGPGTPLPGITSLGYVPWTNPIVLFANYTTNNTGGNLSSGTDASGTGGGGGGGDGVNSGGGGGEGGQFVLILARHIVHGPANNYALQGGNGANATAGNCGGGGGGGAGWWATISDTLAGTANTTGVGGTGGTGIGTGTNGDNGQAGIGQLHILNKAAC